MRFSDWSSDLCSSDLLRLSPGRVLGPSLCGVGLTDCVDDLLNELIGCGILSRSAGDILTRSDVASLTANQSCYLLFERLLARRGRRPFEEVANLCNCSRSEEHTSELQSLMRISYAVFCLKKQKKKK